MLDLKLAGCVQKIVGTEVLYMFQLTAERGIKPTSIMQTVRAGMMELSLTQLDLPEPMFGTVANMYLHQAIWSCTSSVNMPWLDMEYDVSNLSGNNVSFRFRQMADSAVQEPGWYVDDIGLEVAGLRPRALGCPVGLNS